MDAITFQCPCPCPYIANGLLSIWSFGYLAIIWISLQNSLLLFDWAYFYSSRFTLQQQLQNTLKARQQCAQIRQKDFSSQPTDIRLVEQWTLVVATSLLCRLHNKVVHRALDQGVLSRVVRPLRGNALQLASTLT